MVLLKMFETFIEKRVERKEKKIMQDEYQSILADAAEYIKQPIKERRKHARKR